MNLDKLQLMPDQQTEDRFTECAGISIADVIGNMAGVAMDPDFSYAAGFNVIGETPSTAGEEPINAVDGAIAFGCLPASLETFTALSNGESFVMQFQNYPPQQKADALRYAANGKQYLYTFDDIWAWIQSGKSGVIIPIRYYQTFNTPTPQGFLQQPQGQTSNHCIAAYDYGMDGTQRYIVVKMWLGKNYGQGGYVKMYESIFEQVFLGPAFGIDPTATRWISLLGITARRFPYFLQYLPFIIKKKLSMNPQDKLYGIAVGLLGHHLTMNNAVPAMEGCAEAVSRVLESAGYPIPAGGIPNVNGIIQWALNHGFEEIQQPQYGCIITAHNPDVNNPNFAHVGITLRHGIASNNSFGGVVGLFTENYSYAEWDSFFGTVHGSNIRYFKPLK